MMPALVRALLLSAVLALLVLPATAGPARAAGEPTYGRGYTGLPPVATVVLIRRLPRLTLGGQGVVAASLLTAGGYPLVGAHLHLIVDGIRQREAVTNSAGEALLPVRRILSAGDHALGVQFFGLRGYAPAGVTVPLPVGLYRLQVRTVPTLPGARFALDGWTFTAGPDGTATIAVRWAGTYRLRVLPDGRSGRRTRFIRWSDNRFSPVRPIHLPHAGSLAAGFEVSYPASIRFFDRGANPVSARRVTALTVKGSDGVVHQYIAGPQALTGPHWLLADRPVRRQDGLVDSRIQYAVLDVTVDGSNAVNMQQQRFYLDPNRPWPVHLLLYHAAFQARDALFGFPLGSQVQIEYPDGRIVDRALDSSGNTRVDSLVRGIYRVAVGGASGIAPLTSLALTRDQTVRLSVVSTLDLIVAAVAVLLFAVGFLLLGRASLRRAMLRPVRRVLARA